MDLTASARQPARRCLGRFSHGIIDPAIRREAKRQARLWVKAITGTGDLSLLCREECLQVVEVASQVPPGGIEQAILACGRSFKPKPTRRKYGAYKRRMTETTSWRDEVDV